MAVWDWEWEVIGEFVNDLADSLECEEGYSIEDATLLAVDMAVDTMELIETYN